MPTSQNPQPRNTQPAGFAAFTVIWAGQLVSLTGSAMTWFAFTIWAWQTTGEATALALVGFFAYAPQLLFSPVAGALVDRWSRKWVMMLSDLGTAAGTLAILVLYFTGQLQMWHLYGIGILAGFFMAFQFPAYSAAVTTMLPKEHYARAEGMIGMAQSASGIIAPFLGAVLLGVVGIAGIMVIDLVTFVAAFGTLLWAHIPRPARTEAGLEGEGSLWQESLYGFRHIFAQPSLRALTTLYFVGNIFEGLGVTIMAPMILARTDQNEVILGSVQSLGALGGIAGGVLVTIWGGPKRRVLGIIISWACACLLGLGGMGLGAGLLVWAAGSFCFAFFSAILESTDQALWQVKVAPDVQGRVFASRSLVIQTSYVLAMPLAGWLADQWLEPAMAPAGALSGLRWLTGSGPGAGMSLLLVGAGFGGMVAILSSYAFKSVRQAEQLLPDCGPQSRQVTSRGWSFRGQIY